MNTLNLNAKAKFKKEQIFFHPEQKVFVIVDSVDFYEGEGKGWLYSLRVYNHTAKTTGAPFKRYYEGKMIEKLTPLRETKAVQVLYGSKPSGRKTKRG